MNIKPGDLFQWECLDTRESVPSDAETFSTTLKKWIPCGGLCLCVGHVKIMGYECYDFYWVLRDKLYISTYYGQRLWHMHGPMIIPVLVK